MKKINWLDHIANLLVVILGISIAFYLEGYREEKANKQQEMKYIKSLIEDLETDLQAFDTLRGINDMIGDAIIILSDASVGGSLNRDSLMNYLLLTQYNPPFSPQLTTYESLKASGEMDIINDFELRGRIVELYEQFYRGASQYDQVIDESLRDFYKPFYIQKITVRGPRSVDDSFLTQSEFRNMIFSYRFLFLSKTEFYNEVSDELRETLSKLRKYSSK